MSLVLLEVPGSNLLYGSLVCPVCAPDSHGACSCRTPLEIWSPRTHCWETMGVLCLLVPHSRAVKLSGAAMVDGVSMKSSAVMDLGAMMMIGVKARTDVGLHSSAQIAVGTFTD